MKQLILVVDDDINIAKLVKLYLEKDGYEVAHSARGWHCAVTPALVTMEKP